MICICLSCRLSADSVEGVERRILTFIFWNQLGSLWILCIPSLQLCPRILYRMTVWILERSTSRTVGRCGIAQKEGAGIQGTWRRDSSAQAWCSQGKGSVRSAVNDIGWMLYRIRYRTQYIMTWPSISNVRKTFDIVYDVIISTCDIEQCQIDIEGMKPRYR
jgi:hypothetical protein